MATSKKCPQCGTDLSPDAPGGHCPHCLLNLGLEMDPSPALPVIEKSGDRIGRYQLLQQIGEGGCGIVYLAEQEEPVRREVALKIIKLGMDTRAVIARFEAEKQALALMDHPNIAKVFDAGATETGRPYFVMELVRGTKITDYCDQQKLSIRQRLDLFTQVCQAIQHAHQKGIIHRDIKPSNVLVTTQDGVASPKIIDFGIAKATSDQQLTDKTLFTAFEQFIGTPAYMSPEQAGLGGLDIDTRTDIYSLGVLLYELLTGCQPFDPAELRRSALDEVLRILREKEPPRPSSRLTTLTKQDLTLAAERSQTAPARLPGLLRGDLDWIVMKALEKDRQRRYETANAFAQDIRRHLDHEPILARPPGAWYRFKKFSRRHRAASVAGAFILLSLIAITVVSETQAIRARRAELQMRTEAARTQQVINFLNDMLRGVDPGVAAGRDTVLLKELLDRTTANVDQQLTNQPEVHIVLLHMLGETYRRLREDPSAEKLLRQGVQLYHGGAEMDPLDAADMLDSLGFILRRKHNLDEAEKCFREALEIRKKLPVNQNSVLGLSDANLGLVALDRNDLPGAEKLYLSALTYRRQIFGETNNLVANTLFMLGQIKVRQKDLAAAEKYHREALAVRRQLFGELHPDVAESLDSLGRLLCDEKNTDEGLSLQRAALEMDGKLFGEGNRTLIGARLGLGKSYFNAKHFAEAEQMFQTNILFARQLPDRGGLTFYYSIHWLALAQFSQGNYTNAEPLLLEGWAGLQPLADHGRGTDVNYCDRFIQLYQGLQRTNDVIAWQQRRQAALHPAVKTVPAGN